MDRALRRRLSALLAGTLAAALLGPVSSACASKASIKNAIRHWSPKVLVAEGHTTSAIGELATTQAVAPVQAAIVGSIAALNGMRNAVAHQSANAPRVKLAKQKIESGLEAVIVAYQHLDTAFGEKASNPEAATAEAMDAENVVKAGKAKLKQGIQLLD
jgi:hypothetical protein